MNMNFMGGDNQDLFWKLRRLTVWGNILGTDTQFLCHSITLCKESEGLGKCHPKKLNNIRL